MEARYCVLKIGCVNFCDGEGGRFTLIFFGPQKWTRIFSFSTTKNICAYPCLSVANSSSPTKNGHAPQKVIKKLDLL